MLTKKERLQRICEGKEIRLFAAKPVDKSSVTLVEAFRNCGRKNCRLCKDKKKRPHGPYWNLNYTDEHGRMRTLYVGKKLPDFISSTHKVLFADIHRYWRLNEDFREANIRHRMEVQRLKSEIETLYEQLRISKKHARRSGAAPDKIFRELVNKYHPDRHHGRTFTAEDVMKDINRLWQKIR
ncbi:MAG TPA: DUF6788 family protein [Acidobacteriota bacterium]|nr:DUF6788 family protein [Acidobacteriota bacterium]